MRRLVAASMVILGLCWASSADAQVGPAAGQAVPKGLAGIVGNKMARPQMPMGFPAARPMAIVPKWYRISGPTSWAGRLNAVVMVPGPGLILFQPGPTDTRARGNTVYTLAVLSSQGFTPYKGVIRLDGVVQSAKPVDRNLLGCRFTLTGRETGARNAQGKRVIQYELSFHHPRRFGYLGTGVIDR